MIRNATTAVMNLPTLTPAIATALKSGCAPSLPMMSMISWVKLVTTAPNAAAMMKATASSIRFPRSRKSLKPFIVLLVVSPHGYPEDRGR